MDTQSTTKNLTFPTKQLSLVATPSKHLKFLSVQRTARKVRLHNSFPLGTPIGPSKPGRALGRNLERPNNTQTTQPLNSKYTEHRVPLPRTIGTSWEERRDWEGTIFWGNPHPSFGRSRLMQDEPGLDPLCRTHDLWVIEPIGVAHNLNGTNQQL